MSNLYYRENGKYQIFYFKASELLLGDTARLQSDGRLGITSCSQRNGDSGRTNDSVLRERANSQVRLHNPLPEACVPEESLPSAPLIKTADSVAARRQRALNDFKEAGRVSLRALS